MSDLIEHARELRATWDERHTRSWAAAATLTMQAHLGEIEIIGRHLQSLDDASVVQLTKDLNYLEQAECHADEGQIGEPAARSILEIALKYARIVASRDLPQVPA